MAREKEPEIPLTLEKIISTPMAFHIGRPVIGRMFGAPPPGYEPPDIRGLTMDTALPAPSHE